MKCINCLGFYALMFSEIYNLWLEFHRFIFLRDQLAYFLDRKYCKGIIIIFLLLCALDISTTFTFLLCVDEN